MKYLYLLPLIGAGAASVTGFVSTATATVTKVDSNATTVRNANHIFNAIRGAMRQWDSSWNHNGMSFFRATVPEGVQVYHGTYTDKAIIGMQWLAFEPEHAIGFARARKGHPPLEMKPEEEEEEEDDFWWEEDMEGSPFSPEEGDCKKHHQPPPPKFSAFPDRRPHLPPPPPRKGRDRDSHDQDGHPPPPPRFRGPHNKPGRGRDEPFPPPSHPIAPDDRRQQAMHGDDAIIPSPSFLDDGPSDADYGYLHFYRTLHPLNLLLVDGMSAGKTSRGTLDSQDYALLLGRPLTESLPPPETNRTHLPSPFQDGYRAEAMCNISRDDWDNRVDGFIRMETGFEIILCDFSAHLELVRAQPNIQNGARMGPGGPGGPGSFRFYQAIADRFHGIGGGRVTVDYANMVSAFSYNFDIFVNDTIISGEVLPRLANVSQTGLDALYSDVTNMVLDPLPKSAVDWQAVAEMVVQHFANSLQQFVSPDVTPGNDFITTLKALLRPVMSDREKDAAVVTQRCVEQFVPMSYGDTLAGKSVHEVTRHICSTLVETLSTFPASDEDDLILGISGQELVSKARGNISKLMAYLAWPIWRECYPSCAPNEVCVLPIWPITSNIEDRKQPSCKNATQFAGERGPGGPGRRGEKNYWYDGDEGPGGPKGPGPRRQSGKSRPSKSRLSWLTYLGMV